LVLQFGGAAGLGMSAARGRGPASRRPEGERRRERTSIKFPRPRYKSVVIMNPAHFNWLPMPDAVGVERKYMGSFTERGFWIEMIKIDAGAEWVSTCEGARRLIVAFSGTATVEGKHIGRLAAIQADAGEKLQVSVTEAMVLYIVGLPPVQLPSIPSDQFDIIESDGAIQFENPRHAV
jgi:hypothetical protein